MKKLVLALSVVALAISCKKLPEGGNKGVLKREDGVERYTDDVQGVDHSTHTHHTEGKDSTAVITDSVAVLQNHIH